MTPLAYGPRLRRLRKQAMVCSEFQWLEISNEQLHTAITPRRSRSRNLFRSFQYTRGFSTTGRGEAKVAKAVALDVSPRAVLSGGRKEEDKEGEKEEGLDKLYKSVGILTGLQFVSNIGFGCGVPVLPLFAASLDMGPTGVGLILSISALSRLIFAIPSGRLSDAGRGRRPLMFAGSLMTSMASFGTGLSTYMLPVLANRFLLGAGSSLQITASAAYVADLTSSRPSLRAKVLGFQQTIINSAYAFGPALGGFVCDVYGARMTFALVGFANLIACGGYYFLPESIPKKRVQESKDSTYDIYRSLLKSTNQQCLILLNFATFTSYAATMTIIPLHYMNIAGTSDGTAGKVGLIFAGGAVLGALGAPVGGWLADRFGRKRTMLPASLLVVAGTIGCTLESVNSFEALLPPIMLWAFGNGLVQPGMAAFAADIAKDAQTRAQALSVSRMAGDVAFLVSPIGLGLIADMTSCSVALYTASFTVLAANCMFALRATESYKPRV